MSKHTPTPWTVEDPMGFELSIVESGKEAYEWRFIACVPLNENPEPNEISQKEARANAAHIVRCANCFDELLAMLMAYEQWEADLIMSQDAWQGGALEFPELTEPLWDRLMEIQKMRNAAKRKATEGAPPCPSS